MIIFRSPTRTVAASIQPPGVEDFIIFSKVGQFTKLIFSRQVIILDIQKFDCIQKTLDFNI